MRSRLFHITFCMATIAAIGLSGCAMFNDGDDFEECYFVDPDADGLTPKPLPAMQNSNPPPTQVLPGPAAVR